MRPLLVMMVLQRLISVMLIKSMSTIPAKVAIYTNHQVLKSSTIFKRVQIVLTWDNLKTKFFRTGAFVPVLLFTSL